MSPPQMSQRRFDRVRHIVYLLVGVVVLLPYAFPLPLKFTPSPEAKALYQQIERLPAGSRVLLSFDFDPASEAELYPMTQSLLQHCFNKGVVPVVMTHWPNGLDMSKKACEEAAAAAEKRLGRPFKSGVDWVFLGFRPGTSNLVINMGENLKGAFDKDIYGQSTQTMPALQGMNSLRDFRFAIDLAAGATVEMWIAFGADRFHVPLGVGTTAVQAPNLIPFVQSKQIVGLLGGLRGAADYELLVKLPGPATRGMQAQSATHLLIIILIVAANVRLFIGLARRRREASNG